MSKPKQMSAREALAIVLEERRRERLNSPEGQLDLAYRDLDGARQELDEMRQEIDRLNLQSMIAMSLLTPKQVKKFRKEYNKSMNMWECQACKKGGKHGH